MARRGLSHERHVLLMSLAAGAVPAVIALALLAFGGYTPRARWTLGGIAVLGWLGVAFALRELVVRPLRTVSNLLAALREEDFSFRARGADPEDALGLALYEVNALADTLREERLGALEATALLRKVMEEIDVAVFTFDPRHELVLVNAAGARLLGQPPERLIGRRADELNLEPALAVEARAVLDLALPGAGGRWEVSGGTFRQGGVPHRLLVLTDVSRALREEERAAWQRLIRVLGHELNNSLAPIRSLADSLKSLIAREPRPADWQDDAQRGLGVIASRADALSRFMEAYGRLARLPPPRFDPVDLDALVRRVAGLESRVPVEVRPGPALIVRADGAQLEQLLINLLKNAAEASADTGGRVAVGWVASGDRLEVHVDDEGHGLPPTANLFVPFFTTKPGGSGIGLVLSRQIAEAHGGTLVLENRADARGCRARLRLPLARSAAVDAAG
jgi:nitrogen fixation/metabolism regulation signal transduction histidine kinase